MPGAAGGRAGAVLLTEEALELPGAEGLLESFRRQPAWSELPLIILTSGGESRNAQIAAEVAGTVTLLERPMSAGTLLQSVRVALGSRQRQYQVRDLLAERERAEAVLRESERLLSELIERCPFGIYIVDSAFRIWRMNTRSQEGAFRSVQPVIGHPLDEVMRILWPEPVAAEIIRRFRHTLETGESYYSRDFMNPRGDVGQVEAYEWELHRMRLPDGAYVVICYYFDSTELRLAQEALRARTAELQRTMEELRRSNRDLEHFAYAASHDLQEPLRAVGGYVQLLQLRLPEQLDEKARHYIQGAREGAQRMAQQILDLLELSRVGTKGLKLERLNLGKPLEMALGNLEFPICECDAAVTMDPLPTLMVDRDQMIRLFQNLIGNALKFRKEGKPQIHVGARREGGRWVVWVRDNGIGIEPQYFERIFQVFQRLHSREKYPGTGVGLSLCQRIVERHGGQIWVESQLGQGTTFYFALPEGENGDETKAEVVLAAAETPGGETESKGRS